MISCYRTNAITPPAPCFRETRCSANRSAINERVARGNLSQFNSLDFLLPWFGTKGSKVQILSPRLPALIFAGFLIRPLATLILAGQLL